MRVRVTQGRRMLLMTTAQGEAVAQGLRMLLMTTAQGEAVTQGGVALAVQKALTGTAGHAAATGPTTPGGGSVSAFVTAEKSRGLDPRSMSDAMMGVISRVLLLAHLHTCAG